MSSWSDKLQPFTPYVSQLPVESMVSVGMKIQEDYDKCVQKIQSSIDNIAGLDIMRDVDKGYLQSKLDALGNNLKGVAAADFSNSQLTNSVAGMASQIGKDNIIRNAVYSTQVVRKGQKDLEIAKQEGKSSVQNEDWWNTQVGSYLGNKDLNTTFNGQYVPYTDLTEKYAKVAKDVEATEYSYDQPYQTNADGSLKYFTTDKRGRNIETTPDKGQPMIDDAMKIITVKGKAAQTILNNFYDNTTENDRRQLQIDGAYHYKNANVDTFKNDIVATFALQKKQLTDYTTELTVALKNPKLSDKEKAVMQARLTDINSTLSEGKLDEQLQNSLEALQNPANLADFKTKLYTQKYLTNLAQDKSTESYKEELKSNPYAQMNMEKKKLAFDVQKENTRISQWNTSHQWDVYKWSEEWRLKQKEAKDKIGSEPITIPGGKNTDIEPATAFTLTARIANNNDALKRLDNDFLSQNKNYTPATLKAFADKYDTDPNSLDLKDNDLREYLNKRRAIDHDNIRVGQLQKKLVEVTAPLEAELDKVFNAQGGVVDKSGRQIYSPKELYDFTINRANFIETGGKGYGVGPYTGAGKTSFDTEGLINKYKGTKYEPLAIATAKNWLGHPLTATEKVLVNKADDVYKQNSSTVSKNFSDKLTAESNYLATKMPEFMTMEGTLDRENKEDMRRITALISDSKNPSTGIIDVNKKSDFNPDLVTKWREDPKIKDVDYRIIKNYDGSAKVIIQHGTEVQSIPLTADTFNRYFPRYAEVSPITQMKNDILSSPENTTNILHRGDPVNAAYTGYNIPNLQGTNYASRVRYDVEGTASNTGAPTDKYQVRVYACDDKGQWHQDVINQTGYIGEERIQDAINMIGTDVIANILKK